MPLIYVFSLCFSLISLLMHITLTFPMCFPMTFSPTASYFNFELLFHFETFFKVKWPKILTAILTYRLFLMILQLPIFMTRIFEISIEMNVYALHFLSCEIYISVSFTLYFAFTSITFHLLSFPLSWLNIVFWRSSHLLLFLVSPANLVPLADLLSQCSITFQEQFLYERELITISHSETLFCFSPVSSFFNPLES